MIAQRICRDFVRTYCGQGDSPPWGFIRRCYKARARICQRRLAAKGSSPFSAINKKVPKLFATPELSWQGQKDFQLLRSPSCGSQNCLRLGAARNFDRCAIIASLLPPPAALRR